MSNCPPTTRIREMATSQRLVYVNYGAPSDYEQLDAMGVPVKGAKIMTGSNRWSGVFLSAFADSLIAVRSRAS